MKIGEDFVVVADYAVFFTTVCKQRIEFFGGRASDFVFLSVGVYIFFL